LAAIAPPWFAALVVMRFWPTTTSAEALLAVGMLLKMRTRLLSRSAIINCVPFDQRPKGLFRVFAFTATPWLAVFPVKLVWPMTRSAEAPLAPGMALKRRTRWFSWSAMANPPPTTQGFVALLSVFAPIPPWLAPVTVKFAWPMATEAAWLVVKARTGWIESARTISPKAPARRDPMERSTEGESLDGAGALVAVKPLERTRPLRRDNPDDGPRFDPDRERRISIFLPVGRNPRDPTQFEQRWILLNS